MADRGKFTLLTEAWEDWQSLSLEKRGLLITAILLYERGEAVPNMDAETNAVFRPIRRQLDEQYEKQLAHLEKQRANGKKGGRPKKEEPKAEPKPISPQVRRVVVEDDGFEEFWKEYPKKVGKADARKSWTKLKPNRVLREHMLDTLRQAKASDQWRKDGGKYIPNPSTWLNQGRYDDDVSTYSRSVKTVQTNFHNMDSRPDDDLEAWALQKQMAELNGL